MKVLSSRDRDMKKPAAIKRQPSVGFWSGRLSYLNKYLNIILLSFSVFLAIFFDER